MPTKVERFLNVVYVADGNFLPHVSAALVSLAENAGDDISKVFVGVEKASKTKVAKLDKTGTNLFGKRFHLVFLDDEALPHMRTRLHISSTAHKRFLVDKIVHPMDSHVLYLDGDTLVCSRLSSLSALTEEIASDGNDAQPALWASRDFSPSKLHGSKIFSGDLFNSGVMLINLHKWRRRAPLEDLIKVSLEHENLINGDQDALNLIFQGQWAEIGSDYNSTDRSGPEHTTAIIKHFTGSDKPWSWGTQHPWKRLYKAYRRKSGFWPFLPTVLWFRVRRRLVRKLIDPIYLRIRRQ